MLASLLLACVSPPPGAWLPDAVDAPSPGGALDVAVEADGATVFAGDDVVRFRTLPLGEPTGRRATDPDRALGVRSAGAATEWWERAGAGLRQGWIVPEPVDGGIDLAVTVEGAHVLQVEPQRASLEGDAGTLLRYEGVHAWDATGAELPAALHAEEGVLHVTVADDGAVYPVTVDPVTTAVGQSMGTVGVGASTRADLNGDGYDDLITNNNGYYAYVFNGGASGVSATVSATLASGTYYRNDIVTADFDGDGYDDVAVGGWGDPGGEVNVHYGAASGVSTSAGTNWTNSTRRFYAYMIGAGDFNGDGYDDLAVGASADADYEVHYGSPSGLSSTANVTFSLLPIIAPYSMWGAGDYNGDGYDDLAIGVTGLSKVMVIRGSALGLQTGSKPLLIAGNSGTSYGNMISSGDVNGDGRDDLVVGARDESKAYLYLGNAGFLTATPATTFTGSSAYLGLYFGVLGDTDADGYDDVGFGEYYSSDAGHGYVYAGNASGSLTSRQTVTGATAGMDPACTNEQMMAAYAVGDLNGDGYDDFATGASTLTSGSCTGGGSGTINRVFLWWGTP